MTHRPLLNVIAISSQARLPGTSLFGPQELANTAWSFSALRETHAPVRIARQQRSALCAGLFSVQNLANPPWAIACLSIQDGPLLYPIALGYQQRVGEGGDEDGTQCGLLWATWRTHGDGMMLRVVEAVFSQQFDG